MTIPKLLSALFLISLLISSCSKKSDDPVASRPTYFMQATIEGKVYTFDASDSFATNAINATGAYKNWFSIGANNTQEVTDISLFADASLTGQPKTLPIIYGRFKKDRFNLYSKNMTIANLVSGPVGMCTVTKVDNKEVEGTFYFDAYNDSNQKISVTNGSFRMKFY